MKKIILSVLAMMVVAMFVLAGCGGSDTTQEVKPVPKSSADAPAKTVQATPEPEPEPEMAAPESEPEPAPKKAMAKAVSEILTKHSRVKSLTYLYQDPSNYPMEWPTWVMDNKMAIDLREVTQVSGDTYISKVYLNSASKTAAGYCESKVYRCADPNEKVDVKFAKYTRKTPLEWVKSVTYAEKEAEETKQQRRVLKLRFEDSEGNSGLMWIDDYYGVPMEVWVKDGSKTTKYVYEDLGINTVEDSDLEHQMITGSYNV